MSKKTKKDLETENAVLSYWLKQCYFYLGSGKYTPFEITKIIKALEIIKKYTYSGGWSGDYTTEYWKMKAEEIKVMDEVFEKVPCHPLSEKS